MAFNISSAVAGIPPARAGLSSCFRVTRVHLRFPILQVTGTLLRPLAPAQRRHNGSRLAQTPVSPAAPVCGDAPDTSGSRPPGCPTRSGSGSGSSSAPAPHSLLPGTE